MFDFLIQKSLGLLVSITFRQFQQLDLHCNSHDSQQIGLIRHIIFGGFELFQDISIILAVTFLYDLFSQGWGKYYGIALPACPDSLLKQTLVTVRCSAESKIQVRSSFYLSKKKVATHIQNLF